MSTKNKSEDTLLFFSTRQCGNRGFPVLLLFYIIPHLPAPVTSPYIKSSKRMCRKTAGPRASFFLLRYTHEQKEGDNKILGAFRERKEMAAVCVLGREIFFFRRRTRRGVNLTRDLCDRSRTKEGSRNKKGRRRLVILYIIPGALRGRGHKSDFFYPETKEGAFYRRFSFCSAGQ